MGKFSRCQTDEMLVFKKKKKDLTFHANGVLGDNLHEMSNLIFWEINSQKHILFCLLKFLPSMLSVNFDL